MGTTKLKLASQWLGAGALCGLLGGVALAAGFARRDGVSPPAAGDPRPAAPLAPVKAALGLRHASLRVESNFVSVAFSSDGKTIASTDYAGVTLWDAAGGNVVARFAGHDAGCTGHLALHPDGKRLAVSCAGSPGADKELHTVYVWDASDAATLRAAGRPHLALRGHAATPSALAYSTDGKALASGAFDHTARLWDAATGKELHTLKHAGPVDALAFRPDGKVLATGGRDDGITLWDAATGRRLAALVGPEPGDSPLAFTPDGKAVATVSADRGVVLWDVPADPEGKARERVAFGGHRGAVHHLAFSPDGRWLATGGEDRTVRLWEVATGKQKAALTRHQKAVRAVAFSPDGAALASGGGDDTIHLWDVHRELNRTTAAAVPAAPVVRRIDLPPTAAGYAALASRVIDDRAGYEELLEQVKRATPRAEDATGVLKALAAGEIDFARESLVLIRHTDTTRVRMTAPAADGDALVCVVRREGRPDGDAKAVPYCFALAVAKGKAARVEVVVQNPAGDD